MSLEYNSSANKIVFGGDLELLRSAANEVSLGAGDAWAANSINWTGVDKTGSSLADLATRSYSDLTSRPADDDFNTLTAETSIADDDSVLIYDTSASAYRKMTRANFVSGVAPVAAGDTGQIQFNNSDAFAADAALFWDNTNKRLGIGTATPEYGIVNAAEDGDSNIVSKRASADANQGGFVGQKARGTLSSPTAVQSGDYLVRLLGQGYDGASFVPGGSVDFVTSGAPATGYVPTAFVVNTSTGTASMVERFRISSDGKLSTGGETAPDVTAGGLCLNQGADDLNILTFKSSDVAHPMTTQAEADTYFKATKLQATGGGVNLSGYADTDSTFKAGMYLGGFVVSANSGNTEFGAVTLNSYKTDGGTGVTGLATTENALAVRNGENVVVVVKGSGDIISQAGIQVSSFGQTAAAGAIQWTGTHFQGYDGSSWVDLDVQDTSGAPLGSDGQMQYNNGGVWGACAQLYWDDVNNRVGIGTSTPIYSLDVSSATTNGLGGFTRYSATATDAAAVYLRRARGTEGTPATVADGDSIGFYGFQTYGSAWTSTAGFYAIVNGTVSGNLIPTDIQVRTHNGTAMATRATFTALGDLNMAAGGIKVGDYAGTDAAGAIQWNGTHFQGYNGSSWVNLDVVGADIVAGNNTEIQFNNSGAFGASSSLTWDGTYLAATNVEVASTGYIYLGDASTDGSWRMGLDTGDIVLEKRVSGVWELEHKFKG